MAKNHPDRLVVQSDMNPRDTANVLWGLCDLGSFDELPHLGIVSTPLRMEDRAVVATFVPRREELMVQLKSRQISAPPKLALVKS